jgi:hypothetical protein
MGAVKPAPKQKTDDDWQREATLSAIAAARAVVSGDGINQRATIGSLSELEWGWIVAAAIFEWIKKRAEQAVAEGTAYELPIQTMSGRDPEPWEAGAVASILPALGNIKGLDWSRPIGEWHKDQITSFAWQIHKLTVAALAARDEGATDKIVKYDRNNQEREVSAANKGPLMSKRELDDEIPF